MSLNLWIRNPAQVRYHSAHPLCCRLDFLVRHMRISERHADLAVTEQPRDHRKRNAVEDGLRGDAVAKVMQAHILDFGLFSHQLP